MRFKLLALLMSFICQMGSASVWISEIDVDQSSTDSAEFIELYSNSGGNVSLDNYSIVLFNGNGEAEYNTISLDGFTTNAEGVFVIGSGNVPNVDLVSFTTNSLQNGADAVGLYFGPPTTQATTNNLVHAIVYGTSDADDVELLALLGQTTQYDEDQNGNSEGESLFLDGRIWTAGSPTPGTTSIPEPSASAFCLIGFFFLLGFRRSHSR